MMFFFLNKIYNFLIKLIQIKLNEIFHQGVDQLESHKL